MSWAAGRPVERVRPVLSAAERAGHSRRIRSAELAELAELVGVGAEVVVLVVASLGLVRAPRAGVFRSRQDAGLLERHAILRLAAREVGLVVAPAPVAPAQAGAAVDSYSSRRSLSRVPVRFPQMAERGRRRPVATAVVEAAAVEAW